MKARRRRMLSRRSQRYECAAPAASGGKGKGKAKCDDRRAARAVGVDLPLTRWMFMRATTIAPTMETCEGDSDGGA